jgi:hypothetical protein
MSQFKISNGKEGTSFRMNGTANFNSTDSRELLPYQQPDFTAKQDRESQVPFPTFHSGLFSNLKMLRYKIRQESNDTECVARQLAML